MEKAETNEVYVLGFVPCYRLPHKRPCLLDPFLHPLISEIEDAFIDGKCIMIIIQYTATACCLFFVVYKEWPTPLQA